MQRLRRRLERLTRSRERRGGDRGAVSVVVALMTVGLVGLAAVSIDVAALWSDRQQLQVGADAAALAIAQDCADGNCGNPGLTADQFATTNKSDGAATATITSLMAGKVTVRTDTTRNFWFAPVLPGNHQSAPVSARATARWGNPGAGTATLPLAFSWCEFVAQTGGGSPTGTVNHTIYFTKTSGTTCTGPSNNIVPGGFGWLNTNSGTCTATSSEDQVVVSDPGSSVPTGCKVADFSAMQNKVVLLPIFDEYDGSGSNAKYTLYGYAAFKITGYHFGGQYTWNSPCGGNDRCVRGYFVEWVELGNAFTYSPTAPDLGASLVSLSYPPQ
jgi:Flp pilus assembly protein TadG